MYFSSCINEYDSTKYMAFNEVKYIKQFPHSFTLSNEKVIDWDLIGMKRFRIIDSLLITSTVNKEGFWSFYSTQDLSFRGNFLKQGQGPNEFIFAPSLDVTSFQIENDQLVAYIYDFQTGKFYKMNVSKSFRTQELDMSQTNDTLPAFLFDFAMIDSATFYCKEIANNQTQQLRYTLRHGKKEVPKKFDLLNSAAVDKDEDFNIISTISVKHPNKDIIVEAPIALNQINLYSCYGDFEKTICVGEQLDNIDKIQNKIRWTRIYTYGDVRTFNSFFGVLFIGEDQKSLQTDRKKLPIIQLFNYEGEPIAEIKSNRFITDFDIDLNNGYLYALDNKTDEFYKYDIHHILDNITK